MRPYEQKKLFGFEENFKEFVDLYKKNTFPNKIIFSGKKGIGKSTFVFHIVNYIFSIGEEKPYILDSNEIDVDNRSYNLVKNQSHPNFFYIKLNENKKNIDISQIREIINFSSKSSFDDKIKIIFIEDVENLNINAVNALLKIVEEPNNKTFFILTHNYEKKIIDTLKSRCIEFKMKLDNKYIEDIVNYIFNDKLFSTVTDDFSNNFDTPRNFINFINFCEENKLDYKKIKIEEILKFIITNNLYKNIKLDMHEIKLYIELYFRKKIEQTKSNRYYEFYSYFNHKFNESYKYNLDLESCFIELNAKLLNE